MKVNVSIDDDLLNKIDTYADEHFSTRSGLIALACIQYLAQEDMKAAIIDMSRSFHRIADNNEISKEDMATLEKFQWLAQSLSNN